MLTAAMTQAAALAVTGAGAGCLYLGAPRQQWLSRPWPSVSSRIGGGGLLFFGWLLWCCSLHPTTAAFTTLTMSMVFFTFLPFSAAWVAMRRKSRYVQPSTATAPSS